VQQDKRAVVVGVGTVRLDIRVRRVVGKALTSNRPYIIRAWYEWIVDNNCTPCIMADAEMPGVSVPPQYIEEGTIVLDISPQAVQKLLINNEAIECAARFDNAIRHIYIPIQAILAVYALEYEEDSVITFEFEEMPSDESTPNDEPPPPSSKPHLRVVKGGKKKPPPPPKAAKNLIH